MSLQMCKAPAVVAFFLVSASSWINTGAFKQVSVVIHQATMQTDIQKPTDLKMKLNASLDMHPDNLTTSLEDGSIPINSTLKSQARISDVVLLIICLSVPFVIFGSTKSSEFVLKKWSRADSTDTTVRRMGSTYNLTGGDRTQDASTDGQERPRLQITQVLAPGSGEMEDKAPGSALSNALAGFSTAMAALPDAISFSFITGVSPLNGIWAGVFMGISAALCGGRPGMISSASAATAVVLADISTDPDYGMGPMALCVFFVGIFQLIIAALRLSRFITLIPHPVMLGFVNGLAIVMIKAQMRQFRYHGDGDWVEKDIAVGMVITALFAMLAAVTWARIPYVRKILPAPLASVVLTGIFSVIFKEVLPRRTLKNVAGAHTFSGGLAVIPLWDFPPQGVDWHDSAKMVKVILVALRFAIVGILESLMTEALIDQITSTTSSMRQECFGQGVGNILASLFGTQGGCALIAQSLMNVGSGGRTRLSGLTMGITLGLCVVVLAPVMAEIPVAALVGLIVLIALNTFAWSSLMLILRINVIDAVVVVLVTVITVLQDLCIAVVVGVIISALGFAWTAATEVKVDEDVDTATGVRTFFLRGPLFFGSAMNYQNYVVKATIPERIVCLNFSSSRILDLSAIDAIAKTRDYWEERGKEVQLEGLPSEVMKEFKKPEAQVSADASSA